MKKVIHIGLFGLGTVGKGVCELIAKNEELLLQKTGLLLKISKAVVKDKNKTRNLPFPISLSSDPDFILNDPKIDVVVELIGGKELPLKILEKSLTAGKAWVSANKALIAEKGEKVWPWFEKYPKKIGFEASVGAAMPIIALIQEGVAADRIHSIRAIINGTTNYILSEMHQTGISFEKALKEAQEKGFAELDSSFDVDGMDSAHKILILGQLAFHHRFNFSEVNIQGIRSVEGVDLKFANQLGFTIKLLGVAKEQEGQYAIHVYPALVKKDSPLAGVNGSYNAALVQGDFFGKTLIYGLGAGSHPTAVSVVGDICKIMRNLGSDDENRQAKTQSYLAQTYHFEEKPIQPFGEITAEHYIRIRVKDAVGVLAKIASIFSQNGMSMHQILQTEAESTENNQTESNLVDVVILTHLAKNSSIMAMMNQFHAIEIAQAPIKWFLIEKNL